MSRIGKKIINIPEKTEVTVSGTKVVVKGPKGTLEREMSTLVDVKVGATDGKREVTVVPKVVKDSSFDVEPERGAVASHITNMIKGVNETFVKKLIVEGIGYKAEVKGAELVLALGFSHPVKVPIAPTLKVVSDKGIVTISGLDKDEVGQFAAAIRSLKKPEPYKGKGIRYSDEVIRRKQGKKSV